MPTELGSAYGVIEIGTEGAEQSIKSLSDTLKGAGTAMSLAVTAPLVGIAAAAVSSAGEFEQSLNIMQQISGATAEQMQTLQAQALEMGAVTSFSAGEAAQAQLELAKAGLSVNEVIAATPGVLDMAAAGGMGMAESAEIAANAMNAFNLPASEMPGIANMLAAAANASSVDIGDLAAAMKMSGAVFASNKQPMDDMVTALAMLGNAGLKGSDAGTSLKTMMMSLAAPTDKAHSVMQDLGLSVYSADGSMRGFSDILNDLSGITKDMTDEQRNLALSTIFGSDAIRAASILTRDYGKSWDAITDALGNETAASDVANSRMKGMAGAVEYFKGSVDSFLIGTALPFLDSLSGIVRQAADALTAIGALPEPVRNAALAFGAVLAAAGPVMLALAGIGTAVGFILSPIGLLIVGVAGLAAAWTMNFGGIQQITQAALKPIADRFRAVVSAFQGGATSINSILGELGASLFGLNTDAFDTTDAIREFVIALTGSADAADAVDAALATIRGAWQQLSSTVRPIIDGVIVAAQGLYDIIVQQAEPMGDWSGWWEQMVPLLGETAATAITDFASTLVDLSYTFRRAWPAMQAAVQAAWTNIAGALAGAWAWLQIALPAAINWLQSAWGTAWPAMQTAAQTAWAQISGALAGAWAWLQVALPAALATLQGLWTSAWPAIQAALQSAWGVIGPALAQAWAWIQVALPLAVGALQTAWNTAWPAIQTALATAWAVIQPALAAAWAWIQVALPIAVAALQNAWNTAWPAIQAALQTAWAIIGPALTAAWGWLQVALPIAIAAMQNAWNSAWPTIQTALTTAWNAIKPVFDAIGSFFGGVPEKMTGLQTQFGTFGDKLSSIGSTLQQAFAPGLERVQTAFTGLPEKLAPLQPKLDALVGAFGGLVQAIQPLIVLVGGVLGVAAMLGVNLFASVMDRLPSIVGPIIDQVTASIQAVTTIINEMVAGVKAAINGDWAGVWESARMIMAVQINLMRGTFSRMSGAVGAIISAIYDAVVNTLKDLGIDIAPFLETIQTTWNNAWAAIKGAVQPVIDAVGNIKTAISDFSTWLSGITLPNPFQPLMDAGKWVQDHLPGGQQPAVTGEDAASAGGTSYWPGGRTMINERGYEEVALPAGSRVYTNGQTNNLPRQNVTNVNVNMSGIQIKSDLDINVVGQRLGSLIAAQMGA